MGLSTPHAPPPAANPAGEASRRRRHTNVRHVLVYGAVGAVLTAALQLVEYRWLIIGHSFEIYAALVAVLFAGVGLWAGRTLSRPAATATPGTAPLPNDNAPVLDAPRHTAPAPSALRAPFARDTAQVAALGLTPRELDILEGIAAGLSNREIGAQLHVSENTVKTHSSRVFDKLGVQRRVQAVQMARSRGLLP